MYCQQTELSKKKIFNMVFIELYKYKMKLEKNGNNLELSNSPKLIDIKEIDSWHGYSGKILTNWHEYWE